jgi:hypothetical protein
MTDSAAFKATFSDFRIVRSRKVATFLFEVPLEQADTALRALGGIPQAATEVWCAIARLDTKVVEKTKRKFEELPIASQIGIICNEPRFWKFLNEDGYECNGEPDAARIVRSRCGVESRSHITPDTEAWKKWYNLRNNYESWKSYGP